MKKKKPLFFYFFPLLLTFNNASAAPSFKQLSKKGFGTRGRISQTDLNKVAIGCLLLERLESLLRLESLVKFHKSLIEMSAGHLRSNVFKASLDVFESYIKYIS